MTAPCRLPPAPWPRSNFPSGTGQLRSAPTAPFPRPPPFPAPPPPTCALAATLHSTPAAAGPQGPSGEQFPSVSVSSDPSPTRTLTAPDTADPQPCRALPPAVSPPTVGTLLTGLLVWGGSPSASPFFPLASH